MSVETIERSSPTSPERFDISDEEVQLRWQDIAAAENLFEAADEQMSYAKIAELFADKHSARVDDLRSQQEALLEVMLENPSKAFHGELLQLQLLFENRSISTIQYDGTEISEFCTQNHNKGAIDHLFRYSKSPSGKETFGVTKVFDMYGDHTRVQFGWKEGILLIQAEKRVGHSTVMVDVSEDKREQLLVQLFIETIHASSVQLDRTPDELIANDICAKEYLEDFKKIKDYPKRYHKIIDSPA